MKQFILFLIFILITTSGFAAKIKAKCFENEGPAEKVVRSVIVGTHENENVSVLAMQVAGSSRYYEIYTKTPMEALKLYEVISADHGKDKITLEFRNPVEKNLRCGSHSYNLIHTL